MNRTEWEERNGEQEKAKAPELAQDTSPDRRIVDAVLGYRLVKLDRIVGSSGPNNCRALLTVVGLDRTGVIATVSRQLWNLELNILGSFGTLLDDGPGLVGEGLVLLIGGSEARMQALERKVNEVDGKPLRTLAGCPGKIYELRVLAPDEEGIVCRIAEALGKYRANLTTLMSRNTIKPREGSDVMEVMAVIIMTLQVPDNVAAGLEARLIDELRQVLPRQLKISLRDDTEWQS